MYLMVFVFGFLLMSDERYRRALDSNRFLALALGVVCTAADCVVSLYGLGFEDFSPPDIALGLANGFGVWFWLAAILGFGGKYLNAENKTLRYAREGAYPFYILHQSVIVTIGYFAVRMNAEALPKFFIVAVGSLAATIALYDLIVRRTNVTRFLFGMKRIAPGTRSE